MSVVSSGRIVNVYLVKTLKDEFWEKDGLMEEVMDSFIISVGGIDSSEMSSDSEDCLSNSKLERLLSD